MLKRLSRLWIIVAALAFIGTAGAITPLVHSAAEGSPSSSSNAAQPDNPCKNNDHMLTIVVTTQLQNVADGDKLWDSHYKYMRRSHRDFVLTYSLTKGDEQSNPLDPNS